MSCEETERLSSYALDSLPDEERSSLEAHLDRCDTCSTELERLRPLVSAFAAWPRDVVRPIPSLRDRLTQRIARDTGRPPVRPHREWTEPPWADVAPGIECKILGCDAEQRLVSMLVRLAPGGEYPRHTHAAVEELHLLEGELWIDDRKLVAGDYNRAEPGTSDQRVWSQTGCTCVLITSAEDQLH